MEHWRWNLRDGYEDAMGTGVSRWLASRIWDVGLRCTKTKQFGVGIALEFAETELPGLRLLSNTTTIPVHVKP